MEGKESLRIWVKKEFDKNDLDWKTFDFDANYDDEISPSENKTELKKKINILTTGQLCGNGKKSNNSIIKPSVVRYADDIKKQNSEKKDVIKERLKKIAELSIINQEIELQNLKSETGLGLTTLRTLLRKVGTNFNAYEVANKLILGKRLITERESDKIYLYEDGIFIPADKLLKMDLQKLLKAECSEQRIKEIFGHVRRTTSKSEEEIVESNESCICLKNGLFDIENKTLSDFDVGKIFFNKIPIDYIAGADCPEFKEFLKRACTLNDEFDEEKYNTIQEFMGFCLEKGYKIHKFLIIYGDSDTSKTQFMIILQNMLGANNYESIYPQQLFKDNYTSMLYKKMANIADEIPSGIISTTKVKALSGESQQTCRELYEKPFKFINEAKLVFAGNKLPKLKDSDIEDDAVFNRPILIKFNNKIKDSEKIKEFGKKLFEEESSGILNFALDGLKRLNEQGKFSYSKTIAENKMVWLSETELIYKFFLGCADVELKIGSICQKVDLYEVYTKWCDKVGKQWLEYNAFCRKINSLFKGKVISSQPQNQEKGKQEHCWTGIEIKSGGMT